MNQTTSGKSLSEVLLKDPVHQKYEYGSGKAQHDRHNEEKKKKKEKQAKALRDICFISSTVRDRGHPKVHRGGVKQAQRNQWVADGIM